jgi:hypothetical protein
MNLDVLISYKYPSHNHSCELKRQIYFVNLCSRVGGKKKQGKFRYFFSQKNVYTFVNNMIQTYNPNQLKMDSIVSSGKDFFSF